MCVRLTAHTWLYTERAWPPVNHPFTSGCTNTLGDQFPIHFCSALLFLIVFFFRLNFIVSQGRGRWVDKVSHGQPRWQKFLPPLPPLLPSWSEHCCKSHFSRQSGTFYTHYTLWLCQVSLPAGAFAAYPGIHLTLSNSSRCPWAPQ